MHGLSGRRQDQGLVIPMRSNDSEPPDQPDGERGDESFLTAAELIARWRGTVSPDTLANWRSLRIGPGFTKIGREPLYPLAEVRAYERRSRVICSGRSPTVTKDRR